MYTTYVQYVLKVFSLVKAQEEVRQVHADEDRERRREGARKGGREKGRRRKN